MATKAKQAKAPKTSVRDAVLAQWPFLDRLSSSAQRTLIARHKAAIAPTAAANAPAPAKASPATAPAAAALSPMAMPANIRVNDPGEDTGFGNQTTQSEPSIAVHHRKVVVAYNDSTKAPNYTGYSNSANGGHVFQDDGGLPGNQSGDNVLAVDRQGTFYYATLSTDAAGNSSVGVSKSTDGGVTFTPPVNASTTANGPAFFQDKEWLTVDNSGEDSDGNLYLVWTKFGGPGEQILFARSTDGGNTWSAPLVLSGFGGHQAAMPAVGPEGELYVCWIDRGASQLLIQKSTDAGLTFANPVTGGGAVQTIVQIPGTMNGNIRANSFPSIVVDQESGRIFITYAASVGADAGDVFLTVSHDHGKIWSAPVRVNDDATQTDQWMPSVAVTEEGTVGVMFYDRRNDPGANLNIDVYLAISTNHGKTFHANQRITTTSFPPAVNFDPAIAFNYMGDYNQMVASGEKFYLAWGDNRDTVGARHDPNVYFGAFHVED
jgi:hypothetical protein